MTSGTVRVLVKERLDHIAADTFHIRACTAYLRDERGERGLE